MWAAILLALQAARSTPAPCAMPERTQFDFWVGRWDVFATGTDKLVAHSLIEKLYGGCAIRENWMPLTNAGGGSLSAYDGKKGKWHQTWIDSSGSIAQLDGGRQGADMVLEGLWAGAVNPGKDALVRMTYTPAADGSVRQSGLQSTDGGKTWQPSFDFTYKRAL